jgi:hypothetical protein
MREEINLVVHEVWKTGWVRLRLEIKTPARREDNFLEVEVYFQQEWRIGF